MRVDTRQLSIALPEQAKVVVAKRFLTDQSHNIPEHGGWRQPEELSRRVQQQKQRKTPYRKFSLYIKFKDNVGQTCTFAPAAAMAVPAHLLSSIPPHCY